jgi:cytoskeletal protein CcmA (bactofilin family)
MRRVAIGVTALIGFLLALGAVASAQQTEQFLDGKLRMGDRISVGADETVEGDLYVFAGSIEIDGVVQGDLIAFGGMVTIDGTVEGDLVVGSGTVAIDGAVNGDVRAGVGQLRGGGDIGEDLLVGAGQVNLEGDVGGDLVFGAGLMTFDGDVGGDVLGETGQYAMNGTVQGTEDVTIDETTRERPNVWLQALSRFASLLIVGFLILLVRRRMVERTVSAIDHGPGTVVLWGIGFLIGLVVVPLGVTFVGVLLGLLLAWLGLDLLVGLTFLIVALTWMLVAAAGVLLIGVLAPITVGTWLAIRFLPDGTSGYLEMAAGIAAIVLLGLIPFVGPLVGFVVIVIGAGAWLHSAWSLRTERAARSEPAVA